MEPGPDIHRLISAAAERNISICGAESCTGGLVSKLITDVAGASSVFIGSIVAYSNTVKTKVLGVSEESLRRYGAVSEETASEMATGAKKLFAGNISFAVTGIAGPGGGTDDKPAGTVCFAFFDTALTSYRKHFQGDRDSVRTAAAQYIINELLNRIIQD